MSVELPHFSAPFELVRSGVKVVPQGSPEEIASCVYSICVCEEGFREDRPEFGIPPLLFQTVPLNTQALRSQIEAFEPRATVTTTAEQEAMAVALQKIRVELTP
jgi:hypothetical protein